MITSADNRPWPGDVDFAKDLAAAGLPAPSIIRAAKIATIEAAVAEPIGRVSPATLRKVIAELREHIGLP